MGRKSLFEIIALIAFAAFAAVSCYLTVESIHLSLPSIPKWCFWIAIVGLYVLTSYGTKMIMDSFSRSKMIDNRGKKFVGGLLIVLITWLFVSFPTNVHSLFYDKMAKETAKAEELHLKNQLSLLTNEELAKEKFNSDFTKKVERVRTLKGQLKNEITHPDRPGSGERADSTLQTIENALDIKVGTIIRRSNQGMNLKEANTTYKFYDNQIEEQIKIKKQTQEQLLASHMINFNKKAKQIETQIRNIEQNISDLDNPKIDSDAALRQSRELIHTANGTINAENIENTYKGYHSARLTNVTEVWTDYFRGEFTGKDYGLIYWILLSLVIDLAAFCFFNIAFKN